MEDPKVRQAKFEDRVSRNFNNSSQLSEDRRAPSHTDGHWRHSKQNVTGNMNWQGFHTNSTLIGKTNGKANEANRVISASDLDEVSKLIKGVEKGLAEKRGNAC